MALFLFEASPEFLTFAPTDTAGTPIGCGHDERPIHTVQTAFVRAMYSDQGNLPDRLSVGVKRFIVLRSAISSALIAEHKLPGDVRVVPVVVLDHGGKQHLSYDFVLLHSDLQVDIIDRTQSKYAAVTTDEGHEVIVSVKSWCVYGAMVPPLDVFPVVPNDWMITDAVKETLDRSGATGVCLRKVAIT